MTQNSNKTQIRALVEKWASAVRAKDMDGVLASHADDIVMFDVPMPLQFKGMKTERVMSALLQMKKLDISTLQQAYRQR